MIQNQVKSPIVLVGAGGHARSCIDVIEQEGRYAIWGLIGLQHEVGRNVFDYPIIGCDQDLLDIVTPDVAVLVTLGQIKTAKPRVELFETLNSLTDNFPVIVSPQAYISPHAVVNKGTVVMHGAIINAGASVGCNCIINTFALIEHDVVIADHCHISTSSVLNGGVSVGCQTFIGSGSKICQSIHIGEQCFIGMGQTIIRDCENNVRITLVKDSL